MPMIGLSGSKIGLLGGQITRIKDGPVARVELKNKIIMTVTGRTLVTIKRNEGQSSTPMCSKKSSLSKISCVQSSLQPSVMAPPSLWCRDSGDLPPFLA